MSRGTLVHPFCVSALVLFFAAACAPTTTHAGTGPFAGRWTAAFTLESSTLLEQSNSPWFTFTLDLQHQGSQVVGIMQGQGVDVDGRLHGAVDDDGVFHGTMRLAWDDRDWESLTLQLFPDGHTGTGQAIFAGSPAETHVYSIQLRAAHLPAGDSISAQATPVTDTASTAITSGGLSPMSPTQPVLSDLLLSSDIQDPFLAAAIEAALLDELAIESLGERFICSFVVLMPLQGSLDSEVRVFLEATCTQFYFDNGALSTGSGSTTPVALTLVREGSDWRAIDFQRPQVGRWVQDLHEIFPPEALRFLLNPSDADAARLSAARDVLNHQNMQRAMNLFEMPVSPPLPNAIHSIVEPPPATLTIAGAQQTSGVGTHCWARSCADRIGLPTPTEPLVASSPMVATLTLAVGRAPQDVYLQVYAAEDRMRFNWPPSKLQSWNVSFFSAEEHSLAPAISQEFTLQLEPGLYVFSVSCFWEPIIGKPEADVWYGFLVEIR